MYSPIALSLFLLPSVLSLYINVPDAAPAHVAREYNEYRPHNNSTNCSSRKRPNASDRGFKYYQSYENVDSIHTIADYVHGGTFTFAKYVQGSTATVADYKQTGTTTVTAGDQATSVASQGYVEATTMTPAAPTETTTQQAAPSTTDHETVQSVQATTAAATTSATDNIKAATIATSYQGTNHSGDYPSYNSPVVGSTWQEAVLNSHNYYRAAHGLSNLTWSDEGVAGFTNSSKGNPPACTGGDLSATLPSGMSTGSNWAAASDGTMSLSMASGLVDGWYNETLDIPIAAWGLASGSSSDRDNLQILLTGQDAGGFVLGGSKDVGHFTQMVWHDTTEIGCLFASGCAVGWHVQLTCAYMNAGNVMGGDNLWVENVHPRLDSGYAPWKA